MYLDHRQRVVRYEILLMYLGTLANFLFHASHNPFEPFMLRKSYESRHRKS